MGTCSLVNYDSRSAAMLESTCRDTYVLGAVDAESTRYAAQVCGVTRRLRACQEVTALQIDEASGAGWLEPRGICEGEADDV